jgi:hypothetical protein
VCNVAPNVRDGPCGFRRNCLTYYMAEHIILPTWIAVALSRSLTCKVAHNVFLMLGACCTLHMIFYVGITTCHQQPTSLSYIHILHVALAYQHNCHALQHWTGKQYLTLYSFYLLHVSLCVCLMKKGGYPGPHSHC